MPVSALLWCYNFLMSRTIVGILRGGPSSEYDLSLKTGAAMLRALPEERYEARDIFIDRSGVWHVRGIPMNAPRALSQVDVVLNALHGGVGEDGTVQRILERAGVPYTGSRAIGSGLSLNKVRARQVLQDAGIRMPRALSFSLGSAGTTADMARSVFAQFGPPYVVKAANEGSSHGIRIAATIVDLPGIIGNILDAYGAALVEEHISGEEAHLGLIEKFRDQELYVLPPAQMRIPARTRFLNPSMHRSGSARYFVPSAFSHEQKEELIRTARAAHKALGLSHFSAANFIMTKRGPYLLELDAIPHLHQDAAFPPMLEAVGSSVREFLEHAIALARA